MKKIAIPIVLSGLAACATTTSTEGPEIASHRDAVQVAYQGNWDIVKAEANTVMANSVAVINMTNLDGEFKANCGATFISPHYAITAAHCVDQFALNSNTITLEHMDVSGVSNAKITQFQTINNSWPNYSHGATITTDDGLKYESYTCKVVRRCSSSYGNSNCPAGIGNVDIAMLHCGNRPATRNYAVVANHAEVNSNVEVWWFHELANLPATGNSSGTSEADIRFQRYTENRDRDGDGNNHDDNWHYNAGWHQYVPLKSYKFKNGTKYKVLSKGSVTSSMDTPLCHGTSGSGAFLAGSSQFFGPVVTASGSIINRLCHNMNTDTPGVGRSNYVNSNKTLTFYNLSEVSADR